MATIYRLIGLSPNQETRNMLQSQIFSAIAQSSITDYQLRIYELSTSNLLYDSTKISATLYATEEFSVVVPITPALATIRELKWTIEAWNGTDSVTTRETPFMNYETPSANLASTPSTVTNQEYEFNITYSHPQDIQPNNFEIELYDSTETLLQTSDVIYNSSLRYTFDNFLDGTVYKVKGYIEDNNGVKIETSMTQFAVDYSEPSLTFAPSVENKSLVSGIEIKWGGAYSLSGTIDGTYVYVEDFLYTDNVGIRLDETTKITWTDVNIEETNIGSLLINPSTIDYNGEITRYTNTSSGTYLSIGYSETTNQFYREQNGAKEYTQEFTLSPLNAYLLYWSTSKLIIYTYPQGSPWSEIATDQWSDITVLTWGDIKEA